MAERGGGPIPPRHRAGAAHDPARLRARRRMFLRRRLTVLAGLIVLGLATVHVLGGSGSSTPRAGAGTIAAAASHSAKPAGVHASAARTSTLLPGMPAPLSATDVYAADRPNMLSPAVAGARALVYVPNTNSNTVSVIDQATMQVIDTFDGGHEPQHIVPSYDLRTLYVAADYVPAAGGPGQGSLTPIDPKTGKPGTPIPVDDPYNLYFTPDGKYGIVVAEARRRLDFYDPHTWQLQHSLSLPGCNGVDHMDFTADGRTLLASCEFADSVVVIDVATRTLITTIRLPNRADGMPQDVKLSPDGKIFYVADMMANGVYLIDSSTFTIVECLPTGRGTHGLYVDRTSTRLFVTNRYDGSISVIDLRSRHIIATWQLPGKASPDMGNLSADGTIFWLSGRYASSVYAISTVDGHLIKRIPVGDGPHGLCVWPQPGRYSLGHTGIMR